MCGIDQKQQMQSHEDWVSVINNQELRPSDILDVNFSQSSAHHVIS